MSVPNGFVNSWRVFQIAVVARAILPEVILDLASHDEFQLFEKRWGMLAKIAITAAWAKPRCLFAIERVFRCTSFAT